MEEKGDREKEIVKKIKQQIMIPFQWEETPGAPKKDWVIPKCQPIAPVPQPVKYIASVPFKWEEKPGTPLRCFAQETKEISTQETIPENKSLPLPPAYFTKYDNDLYDNNTDDESSYEDDCDDLDWLSELEFEALSVQSEESFCFDPSLLGNPVATTGQAEKPAVEPLQNPIQQNVYHVVTTGQAEKPAVEPLQNPIQQNVNHVVTTGQAEKPAVIPLHNPFLIKQNEWELQEGASSPESSKSPDNYAARNASLRGESFLKQLFPLRPPKSGFLDKGEGNTEKRSRRVQFSVRGFPTWEQYKQLGFDKTGKTEQNGHVQCNEKKPTIMEEYKKLGSEHLRSGVIRRPMTLGELIMQSRRRSYRRKASQMKNKNPQKDISTDKPHQGCFNLGVRAEGLTKLIGKDLLAIKLS